MNKSSFFISILLYVVLLNYKVTIAQAPVLDDFGRETGLYNINPNPNEEPWIVGGNLDSVECELENQHTVPELIIEDKYKSRKLPSEVDNSKEPEFPPILNQVGGSCAQASGISYIFTWEMNVLNNIKATADNQFAYGYTYNFLNFASPTIGSRIQDGWDIAALTGVPTVKDFNNQLDGGLKGTYWMDGYDKYHRANKNRVKDHFIINITVDSGLTKLKQWFYDHGRGDRKGGIVGFASNTRYKIETISSGPHAGKKICIDFGSISSGHAQTLAGYSEDIEFDINNDGKITNNIDINNDKVVDVKDRETGAVLLVNSVGTNWNDSGKVWVPYSVMARQFDEGIVRGINVANHTPKLECKIKVSHNQRRWFKFLTGYHNDITKKTPEQTKDYWLAFGMRSGNVNMGGDGGSEIIEIGLDISDFYDAIHGDKAKIFLIAESTKGIGKLINFSVIDYTTPVPVEYKCSVENKPLSDKKTMFSVIIDMQPTAITNKASKFDYKDVTFFNNSLSLTVPETIGKKSVTLQLYDMLGRLVSSPYNEIYESGNHHINLQNLWKNLAAGAYILRVDIDGVSKTAGIILH